MTDGRIPPQAIKVEEAVLGALLLERDAFINIIDILPTKHIFYKEEHQAIFEAMTTLFNEGKPIDTLTLSQQLRTTGHFEAVGGAFYLSELTNCIASSANIEYHSRLIYELYLRREFIRTCSNGIDQAFDDDDIFDLIDETEAKIMDLTSVFQQKTMRHIKQVLKDTMQDIDKGISEKEQGRSLGVKTGFIDLDMRLGGLIPSDLVILAARPGIGKTTMALNIAYNTATIYDNPVLVFSLEMKDTNLVKKIISDENMMNYDSITYYNLDQNELGTINRSNNKIEKAPIYIDDTASISTMEIRAKTKRAVKKYGIKLVIIDYLQLVKLARSKEREVNSREQEVSAMTRQFKIMAKELDVCVLLLSQMSREVEKRAGKRPQLSDLRESGSIEQDADRVLMLFETELNTEVIIAKNRHGATDSVHLEFKKQFSKFVEFKFESNYKPL